MLFANNVNVNGSEAQKAEFLPAACSGEAVCGMCMSEPDAGTDVMGKTEGTSQVVVLLLERRNGRNEERMNERKEVRVVAKSQPHNFNLQLSHRHLHHPNTTTITTTVIISHH